MTDIFSNKVALVTGAASGMGLATARAFGQAGAAVVLADYRQDQANAEARKLTAADHKAIAIACDVSDGCACLGERPSGGETHARGQLRSRAPLCSRKCRSFCRISF